MVQGISEIAAMCVGLVGLIGAAATTGMPMWRVTAFIGADIIVMETMWEGLWMNCYRQANIRMQCKSYDSLLFLPPDLQAARGLMCCSLALSGVGLLVALVGMRCTSCLQGNDRAKIIVLLVAGGMQFAASICVFIPVSWTGHVIIRDFYNPLLIDAQKRELGEALYVGSMTGAVLFASAVLFVCRRMPSNQGSFDMYHPANTLGYQQRLGKSTLMRYHPISSVSLSSIRSNPNPPSLQGRGSVGPQLVAPLQNIPQVMTSNGTFLNPPVVYNPAMVDNGSLLYNGSMGHHPSIRSSNMMGHTPTPGNSVYMSQHTAPYSLTYNPTLSYQSSFNPVPQTPVFIGYSASRVEPPSHHSSRSGGGVYI
ncbi:claudin-4-like [Genypterus blacodes]|uniref:claudin-4-like n=1 Tax=Genypterus blacodes TaxID=154954 RepID=UPI003F7700C5